MHRLTSICPLALGLLTLVALGVVASPVGAAAKKCEGREATIVGTKGDDTLNGAPHSDVIVGLEGNDTIFGRRGNDRICGLEEPNPGLSVSRDKDKIIGGPGDDALVGGNEQDKLKGEQGDDFLVGYFARAA